MLIEDMSQWEHLKRYINKYVGFDCSQYSDTFTVRRVEVRLRATNLNSFAKYAELLEQSEEERVRLNKELTIHVTNFFRDSSLFDYLIQSVIPFTINQKKLKNSNLVDVWSAGCSTGEEALSIAICFCEALKNKLSDYKIYITGTDLDKNTIEDAYKFLFSEQQFREMKQEYKNKYFEKVDVEGIYLAKPTIINLVNYHVGNIITGPRPKNIDIIFCRNTVIYFSLQAKSNLYVDFYNLLNRGGFLILGKTEVLVGPAREMFQVYDAHERIYCKE